MEANASYTSSTGVPSSVWGDFLQEGIGKMSKHIPNSIPKQILLRDVVADDLPIFYEQQLDPEANSMAAFTAKDPTDREAFLHHWQKILNDESINCVGCHIDCP